MTKDITKDKIRPFFHLKNFKDGVTDAVLEKPFSEEPKSSEYGEGYEFGKTMKTVNNFVNMKLDLNILG